MSNDNNSTSLGDLIIGAMFMWMLFLSIPIAVAGDLAFFIFLKIGMLKNAPKILFILAWFIPALAYGYYVKKFISKFITKDSFGIGLFMYAQGFFLLGVLAIVTDGGVFLSKLLINGFNHVLGGGWLSDYALMFGISAILFALGVRVAKKQPIVKKRYPKYI